jgi:hypothetical protein
LTFHEGVSKSFMFMFIFAFHIITWRASLCSPLCTSNSLPFDLNMDLGPHMRLYMPMQGGFKLHAHEGSIALHHISAINKSAFSFKWQPSGDLNCCWIEIQTLTKGIFSFLFLFQAWISTSLVDLQSSIP